MSISIFAIDDREWWLGETSQQVLDARAQEYGLTREQLLEQNCGEEPRLLTDHQLDTLIYHDEDGATRRSEEHTSELQSLMRISYAVFCLKKKKQIQTKTPTRTIKYEHNTENNTTH